MLAIIVEAGLPFQIIVLCCVLLASIARMEQLFHKNVATVLSRRQEQRLLMNACHASQDTIVQTKAPSCTNVLRATTAHKVFKHRFLALLELMDLIQVLQGF